MEHTIKIVVAPDSFKGTMSAADVCRIAQRELTARGASVHPVPIADGGEGTVDCFHAALPSSVLRTYTVSDLFGRKKEATVCFDGTTAILETASAAGLDHTRLDVMNATTYGVGELIRHALDDGATRIILGLGGSGTTDMGIGMAAALGARFTDGNGDPVSLTGKGLGMIEHVDLTGLDPRLKACEMTAACDVAIPLYGEDGTAKNYAAQKGATEDDIKQLDSGLHRLADVILRDFGFDVNTRDGSGAAGGLGAAMRFFFGGTLVPGMELVLKTVGFDDLVRDADLVLTGEGCTDRQTLSGKVPVGIAAAAKGHRVVCLCGKKGDGWEALLDRGIERVVCINPDGTDFETAKKNCEKNLAETLRTLAL